MQVPPFSLDKQLSSIGTQLEEAVLRVLQSGQYIGGLEISSFEKCFADQICSKNVVGCNSGTDALILALRSLDIGPGDEVITPSFSFFATAEAISDVGATPVFVDIQENGYLIDIDLIERAITANTKAILPVHIFGCPVDMERVIDLARKYGVKVIEDCAQAAGAKWNGRSVGTWGDIGCFSFFPTKNLGAAGDAGAISTNNDYLAKRIRELAVHGMPKRYLHTELGYNSRLDALQAAVLNVKLPKLLGWVKNRNQIASRYIDSLANLPGLKIQNFSSKLPITHGWNQFVIRVTSYSSAEIDPIKNYDNISKIENLGLPNSHSRDCFKYDLEKLGVRTIIYYPIPIHIQPAYKKLGYSINTFPITEKICSQVLSLPIFPEITNDQQDYVIKSIKQLILKSDAQKLTSSMPGSNSLSI